MLREYRVFMTTDPGFVGSLAPYGKVIDKLDGGRMLVKFKAEADCVLMPNNGIRIDDLRVGKFDDPEGY